MRPTILVFAVLGGLAADRALACETALVLAMDVSGSVDAAEYRLQLDGLAAALRDPELRDIMLQDQVALAVTQWSASGQQKVVQDWQRMQSSQAIDRFAAAAATVPRAFAGADTAVGEALDHAVALFDSVQDCRRKVVDLSGDGDENAGFTIQSARRRAIAQHVEVNALAIESIGVSISNYYRRSVITPDGFVQTARGYVDYARAIRLKLRRELQKPAS